MPIQESRGIRIVRVITVLASLYLTYLWMEVVRWDLQRTQVVFHLISLLLFVALCLKAWSGAIWAGVVATILPLSLLIPLDSTSAVLMAMGSLMAPARFYFYAFTILASSLTWTLLVLALHRLTLRSTRARP